MFYLSGLAIFLTAIILTIMMTPRSSLFAFVDMEAFWVVIFPLAAVLFATRSFKVFGAGIMAAVFPQKSISEEVRGQAASLFRFLSKITAFISIIMTIVGFINILLNLDLSDPNAINNLGGNITLALLTVFYGFILIAAVFEPIVFILKKRHEPKRK